MDPLNYKMDVKDPFQSAVQGYQLGSAIQQQGIQQQQQQLALQQQQQQQKVINSLVSNPSASAEDYSRAMLLVPQLKDQLKNSWDTLNTSQQQSHLTDLTQWGSAIQNGQPQFAVDAMNKRADAMAASAGGPTPQSQALKANAGVIAQNPNFGSFLIKAQLAAHPEGSKVISALSTMGQESRAQALATSNLSKNEAEASKAQTEAGVSSATAPAAVEAPFIANQSAQLKQQLDQVNSQIQQANSETERGNLILKRDELNQKLAQTNQDRGADAQNQLEGINGALNVIGQIKSNPGYAGGIGGVGSTMRQIMAKIPGTNATDLQNFNDTLQSQQFLQEVNKMRGLGALTETEGAKVNKAIASLSLDQSPQAYKNSVGVIESNLNRAREKLIASGKLQTNGGAFIMQSPKYGNVTEGQINSLLIKNPGSTRAQVMQFLQQGQGNQ